MLLVDSEFTRRKISELLEIKKRRKIKKKMEMFTRFFFVDCFGKSTFRSSVKCTTEAKPHLSYIFLTLVTKSLNHSNKS